MTYQHLRLYSHYKTQHIHFTTQNDLSTFKTLFTLQNTTNISQLRMTYQHLRLYSHYKTQHKHFTTQNDLSTFKTLFTLQNTTETFHNSE